MKTVVFFGIMSVMALLFMGGVLVLDLGQTANVIDTENQTSEDTNSLPAVGTYTVDIAKSIVHWSGKKPLIAGYINSGTLGISSGSISVAEESSTGLFTLDMNSIKVGLTAKKPGQEGLLEGHLKGKNFFDVAEFPTGTFAIKSATPTADGEQTFFHDVVGDLTLKGVTDEIIFPAKIYLDEGGLLHAQAQLEFDRTKWGITAGSGSFFDDLANNVIDDMVVLSFELIAEKNGTEASITETSEKELVPSFFALMYN